MCKRCGTTPIIHSSDGSRKRRADACFTVDRTIFASREDLAEMIANHLGSDEIVQVVDSKWPAGERLRYTIQRNGNAGHIFDGHGCRLGVFADLDAPAHHAETATA